MRENVQDHQAVFHTAARRNLVAEHRLLAVVVQARIEVRLSGFAIVHAERRASATRSIDRPTREAACDFLHVLLRVAAINS